MATLSGQSINQTYQGLLKLADSSTGITSNLQSIQDGLGNDTGLRIGIDQFESKNLPSLIPLQARYYGSGYSTITGTQYSSGLENIIISTPFYDNGDYSYSAVSIYTAQITSTSDTVQGAIYTSQIINPYGLYPHTPIVSGITADTTTTGLKTFVFPSNISMSGYGGGIYWFVLKITNSGVQPTWRPGQGALSFPFVNYQPMVYGLVETISGNISTGIRGNNSLSSFQVFTGTTTFDNPYSSSLQSTQSSSTSLTGNHPGLVLHSV